MGAAGDVAADGVLVVGLVPGAVGGVAGQHDVAEPGAKRSIWPSMASVMSSVERAGTWQ